MGAREKNTEREHIIPRRQNGVKNIAFLSSFFCKLLKIGKLVTESKEDDFFFSLGKWGGGRATKGRGTEEERFSIAIEIVIVGHRNRHR